MAAHSCTSFRFADSVLHPATVRASRPRAPTLALRILPPGKGQLRIGWDSNPRNGYPFTRSPGACLQPLGHLSTDGVGFEPTMPLRAYRFSRPAPSATRTPIQPTRRTDALERPDA